MRLCATPRVDICSIKGGFIGQGNVITCHEPAMSVGAKCNRMILWDEGDGANGAEPSAHRALLQVHERDETEDREGRHGAPLDSDGRDFI